MRYARWIFAVAAALAVAFTTPSLMAQGRVGAAKKAPGAAVKARAGKPKGAKPKGVQGKAKPPKVDKELKKEAKLDKKAAKLEAKAAKKADKAADKIERTAAKADAKADKLEEKLEGRPGKRLALGKDKRGELRKHIQRLAKIERLKAIAAKTDNAKLKEKVALLEGKEMKRHEKTLARLAKKLDAAPTE